ncbi:MAG: radical SAM protein [Planctomycetales bacterium]|nr:radical SAM protein [Planctomycetales bacterium]
MRSFSKQDIEALRPPVRRPTPGDRALAVVHEKEAYRDNFHQLSIAECLTIFLKGGECPLRCLMCDMWQHTHRAPTPTGNIPKQIEFELSRLQATRPKVLKLYNASNFFAPRNIPSSDLPVIADLIADWPRVVVENHPKFMSAAVLKFSSRLIGELEIAMGLETVHPQLLAWLNKDMSLDDFERACRLCRSASIKLRCFLLLQLPGLTNSENRRWVAKSVEIAVSCGVTHICLIPLRSQSSILAGLLEAGKLTLPTYAQLIQVLLSCKPWGTHSVITADTWNWDLLGGMCAACSPIKKQIIETFNLSQNFDLLDEYPDCECA